MINVKDFGVIGDGVTDDRIAIQALLDGVETEFLFPEGTYLVSQRPGAFYCLLVPAGKHLFGYGDPAAIIQMGPMVGGSVKLLWMGADSSLTRLTLDGDKTHQNVDEHISGVMIKQAPRVTLNTVEARNFPGDGFYIYDGSNDCVVDWCNAHNNGRNGITFGGGTVGGTVIDSTFISNAVQQFDSEPGTSSHVDNLILRGCTFDVGTAAGDFALTISGGSSIQRSDGWEVDSCVLNGGVNIVWTNDIYLHDCTGLNKSAKPHITAWRTNSNLLIENNRLFMDATVAPDSSASIYVAGTGPGSGTSHSVVKNNYVSIFNRAKVFGLRVEGAKDLTVVGNTFEGPGLSAPGWAGIYGRTTIATDTFNALIIRNNRITNFGGYGITIAGNGIAELKLLDISNNIFDDYAGTMITGMSLNDVTNCVKDCRVFDNLYLGGCVNDVVHLPGGTQYPWGTGYRWIM